MTDAGCALAKRSIQIGNPRSDPVPPNGTMKLDRLPNGKHVLVRACGVLDSGDSRVQVPLDSIGSTIR